MSDQTSTQPPPASPGTAGQLPAQKAMKQFSKQPAERGDPDSGDGVAAPDSLDETQARKPSP